MAMMSGVARATYDDVNLILRLYEMRREDRLREARKWFTGNVQGRRRSKSSRRCARRGARRTRPTDGHELLGDGRVVPHERRA